MDKNFITELPLPRVKIPPKPIISIVNNNIKESYVEIIKITKFSIDIWGYLWNILLTWCLFY